MTTQYYTTLKSTYLWTANMNAVATNAVNFLCIGAAGNSNATEANRQIPVTRAHRLKRVRANAPTSGKNADCTVGVSDDGSMIGSVTISAGVAAEYDSGAIDVLIAAGSEVSMTFDTSGSSSGNLTLMPLLAEVEQQIV